jgi:hypothetical protein
MENKTIQTGNISDNTFSIKVAYENYKTVIDGTLYVDKEGVRIVKNTK